MDKTKFRRVGQLILDCLTAIWLVILTFLGSSCVSAGGNVNQEVNSAIEFPPYIESGSESEIVEELHERFWKIPDVSGDLISFLIKE